MKSGWFYSFVTFIFVIKIIYVIFAVIEIYLRYKKKEKTDLYIWSLYWKKRLEFIFVISMAILCIILFNPINKSALVIDHHVQLLLFVYGIIILVTSHWEDFYGNLPPWFKKFQVIV
jgi:uncharacterized membrane protein YiaA